MNTSSPRPTVTFGETAHPEGRGEACAPVETAAGQSRRHGPDPGSVVPGGGEHHSGKAPKWEAGDGGKRNPMLLSGSGGARPSVQVAAVWGVLQNFHLFLRKQNP